VFNKNARAFRVTHPFHPLFGRELPLLERGAPWGHDLVSFVDDAGKVRKFPTAWTDLVGPDPWLVVSAGRSAFRLDDLLLVVELVGRLANDKKQKR